MAKIFKGDVNFGFVINQTGAQPLDSRSVVQNYTELLKSETFGTAIYNGMTVSTIDEQKVYMLVDKTKATLDEGWKEIGAGSGSLAISAFTITSENKIAEATADNIGQIIYVTGGTETYPAGPYIVIADGEVSKLGTTTATGDIAGDVESLKTRVTNVENGKVDKVEGSRLITTDEVNKLSGIASNAEVNYVKSVGDNLSVDVDGKLTVDLSSKVDKTDYASDKTTINNKIAEKTDYSAFTSHVQDTKLHVTDDEKTKWNNAEDNAKAYASGYTDSEITKTKTWVEEQNYLTEHQDISHLAVASSVTEDIATAKEESITSAITSATTYADSLDNAMNARVEVLESSSHTHTNKDELDLIETGDKSKWDKAVLDINAFMTAADSGETAINTLLELQNYIAADSGATAEMLAKIASAQTTAESAQNDVNELEELVGTLSGKVDTDITNLGILTERVEANENNITALTQSATTNASNIESLSAIVGNEDENSGIFEKLSNIYTKDEADNKFLTGITIDSDLNSTSENPVQNKAVFAEFGKVRDEITSAVTGDISAALTNFVKKTEVNTINDIALYGEQSISLQVLAGLGNTITTDKENKTITISSKISNDENNALIVSENGLYVQAIIIDGNDVETI